MKKFGKVEMKGNGSNFIRLRDGEVLIGVFQGDAVTDTPVLRSTHFLKGEKRSVTCTGRADCPICATGDKPKIRGLFNVVVFEEGTFRAKVFEVSATVYNQIAELAEVTDLEKTVLRVKRTGSGTDTEYSIINLPAPPKEFQNIAAVLAEITLHDLQALAKVGTEITESMDNGMPTDEEPADAS